MRSLLWLSVLSAALAGCFAGGGVRVHAYVPPIAPVVAITAPEPVYVAPAPAPVVQTEVYDGEDDAYVEPSSYVYINPDVQVIEDYDYPVFLSGGLYWRYDGGVWYSSSWHDRGWSEAHDVPVTIRHIDRPTAYVHYHADVNARPGQPGYRNAHVTAVVHPAGHAPSRSVGDPRVTTHVTPRGEHPTVTTHVEEHHEEHPTVTTHVEEHHEEHPTVTTHVEEHHESHPTVTTHVTPTSHPAPHPTVTTHTTPKHH